MQIKFSQMPVGEADAIRRRFERKDNTTPDFSYKVKRLFRPPAFNASKSHKNIVISTLDLKKWDKEFKKQNKVTFRTIGDKDYTVLEISFVTVKDIANNPDLFDSQMKHLENSYKDIEEWFKLWFGKIPMVASIHGDQEVPHMNLIFNNFRRGANGKYTANKYSFFNFEHLAKSFDLKLEDGKIGPGARRKIVTALQHEFFEKFGGILKTL